MIGKQIGAWTVVEFSHSHPDRGKYWRCRCVCGAERIIRQCDLRSGKTQSCGCQHPKYLAVNRDRLSLERRGPYWPHTRALYFRHRDMIRRCDDPRHPHYARYGGRGIQVCDAWWANRHAFIEWLLAHNWTPELQIDRVDNDGPYSPENCRLVHRNIQSSNRSDNRFLEWNGIRRTYAEWARALNVTARTIPRRLAMGWSLERTLTTNGDARFT